MNSTKTNKSSGIIKKITAVAMCAMMAVSCCGITASAATNSDTSKSWTLSKSQTSSSSSTTSVLKYYGKITNLKNSSSSNDGVNLYLYYSIPGKGWKQAQHVFAEPGYSASVNSYYKATAKSNWYGKMCSWWINGKNCYATGTFTTK